MFSTAAALDAATASGVLALWTLFSSAMVFPVKGFIIEFKSILLPLAPAWANLTIGLSSIVDPCGKVPPSLAKANLSSALFDNWVC